ncbi:MAG: hypothetical protein FWD66_02190 [Paludibacter sp.]|nr:hypothetical protein [Paludibacter sp.]
MKELKTIRGDKFLVDDEDYEKAAQYRWTLITCKGRRKVVTYHKFTDNPGKSFITYKSLILGLDLKWTMHKNDNPLDLRKENILVFKTRGECTGAINSKYRKGKGFNPNLSKSMQRVTRHSKKSNYYGLHYVPNTLRPWVSTITYMKKLKCLGRFSQDEHAAMAYDQAALEIYGADAKRNFPDLTMEELTERLNKIKLDNKLLSQINKSKKTQGRKLPNVTKTSQYIGIFYIKRNGKKNWGANIGYHRKHYSLGTFYTEEAAAYAYDIKVIELYGAEARRNFPDLTLEGLVEKLAKIKSLYPEDKHGTFSDGRTDKKLKSSKYLGVCLDKTVASHARKWFAHISYKGKKYRLGYFYFEEDAARAYDKKAIELYGENIKRNFPDSTLEELTERLDLIALDADDLSEIRSNTMQGRPGNIESKTSQYVGVWYNKNSTSGRAWVATISRHGNRYNLGVFYAEEDAAKAYDKKAIELYGEKAKLNFPQENELKNKTIE